MLMSRTMPATIISTGCLVLLCAATACSANPSASNLRKFYLQVDDVGPTGGETATGPAATFFNNTSWSSSFLATSCNWDVSSEQIRAARDLGWSIILTTHGSPRWRSRTQGFKNKTLENVTQAMDRQSGAGLTGENVIMEYICEDDSAGVGFPQDLLAMARAANYSNGATLLTPGQAYEAWETYLKEAYIATKPWPAARRHARVGYPHNAHSVAPYADVIEVELTNDDVGSFAPALAFLRGASRQFNVSFGVDLSLWWGVIDGCVQNLPASLHRRVMALSYVAGADLVAVEGCGWVDPATGAPNSMAREVDRFGSLVAGASCPGAPGLPPAARGSPDVIVALVLPRDLGWSERPSWAAGAPTLWSYANIPAAARRGAAAIDGLMSAAYPGAGGAFGFMAFPFGAFADEQHPPASPFARSAVLPPYAPAEHDRFTAAPNLPFGLFHDRDALHKWFQEQGGRDPAPARPMVDSRWGDVMDILVADYDDRWTAASDYKIIVWANDTMSPAAKDALMQRAARGGTVVVAAGAIGPSEAALTGLYPSGEIRAVRALRWLEHGGRGGSDGVEIDHYLAAVASLNQSAGVQVIAASEPEKMPIIVRRPLGQGWVYTCLVPWFGSAGLASPALRLLDYLLVPLQPVSIVDGIPALYWTSSLLADGTSRVAAIANNAGSSWKGSIMLSVGKHSRVKSMLSEQLCTDVICEDVTNGTPLACTLTRNQGNRTAAVMSLEIDEYDVAIVRVSCASRPCD